MKSSRFLIASYLSVVGLTPGVPLAETQPVQRERLTQLFSNLDISDDQHPSLRVALQKLKANRSKPQEHQKNAQLKESVAPIFSNSQERKISDYLRRFKKKKGLKGKDAKPTIYQSNAEQVGLSQAEIQGLVKAAEYSAKNDGLSYLVTIKGLPIVEHYPNGGSQNRALELASGTKSFSGVMALAAVQDGLLSPDEKVSDTITEWQGHPVKRQITVRQLLTLTSGIFGGQIGKVPDYSDSIASPLISLPGNKFSYGPDPFQIFGEIMKRKLGTSPLTYLETRIFQPAGVTYGDWKMTSEGDPRLPSGALFTAREWAQFGEFIRNKGLVNGNSIIDSKLFDTLEVGTTANPAYGLTWWLNEEVSPEIREEIPLLRDGNYLGEARTPKDVFAALGAGGQALFISRSHEIVVVRQAPVSFGLRERGKEKFRYDQFLNLVFSGFDW